MARRYEPAPHTTLRTRFSLTHYRHMKPVADLSLDMFKFTSFPQMVYQPASGLCDTSRGVC